MRDVCHNAFDGIVIGGGAAGCSVAMQLALRGQRVIVLERGLLGSGSTSRAAGLGAQLRATADETRLLKAGLDVVADLERRVDRSLFVRTGSLHVASTADRAREIRDLVAMGKSIDFEIDLIDRGQAERLLPCMRNDDLVEIAYCPTDGYVQPAELLDAYVKVARQTGAVFKTNTPFEKPLLAGGRLQGVRAGGQDYFAPVVVNAAGPWSYLIGRDVDAPVATAAIGHFYLVTQPHADVPIATSAPSIRDRENRIYTRPEMGGLLVGTYETEPIAYEMEELGPDFEMAAMTARRDSIHVATLIDCASRRFPFIDERTPMSVTHGIMTFTPDGHALGGPDPRIEGLYHCTGFCGRGVFQSACIGIVMAALILDGTCRYPVDHLRPERFDDDLTADRGRVREECYRRYADHYTIGKESRTT